jgi:predicted Zn-dependent peptidase
MLDDELSALDRLSWLTEENLRRAKHVLRKRIYSESYLPASTAEAIGRSQYLLDDSRYAFLRLRAIEALTQEDIKRVYHQYLRNPAPIALYVVPEKVPAWLRLFSWLYPAAYRFIKHPLVTHD